MPARRLRQVVVGAFVLIAGCSPSVEHHRPSVVALVEVDSSSSSRAEPSTSAASLTSSESGTTMLPSASLSMEGQASSARAEALSSSGTSAQPGSTLMPNGASIIAQGSYSFREPSAQMPSSSENAVSSSEGASSTNQTSYSFSMTASSGTSNSRTICEPRTAEVCYTGPADTRNVGACRDGSRLCLGDGSGFGSCFGDRTPTSEQCGTSEDEDCDGTPGNSDEDCVCIPGTWERCYTGPTATLDVGSCSAGVRECLLDGHSRGACLMEVLPQTDECYTLEDEDCDGHPPVCAGQSQWFRWMGDTGNRSPTAAVAPDGTSFFLAPRPGTGCNGMTLTSLDARGAVRWTVAIPNACLGTLAAHTGGVVVGASFTGTVQLGTGTLVSADSSDAFIAMADLDGNWLFSRQLGSSGRQTVDALALSEAGTITFSGWTESPLQIDGVPVASSEPWSDVNYSYLASLDSVGQMRYARRSDRVLRFAHAPSGNLVAAGLSYYRRYGCNQGISPHPLGRYISVATLNDDGICLVEHWPALGTGVHNLSVAVDGDDNFTVVGTFKGALELVPGAPLLGNERGEGFVALLTYAWVGKWS